MTSRPLAPADSTEGFAVTGEAPSVSQSNFVESIDPATNQVVARLAPANPGDVPSMLDRARTAQRDWSARPLGERCAIIRRLRDVIFESRDQIVDTISRETGKPRVEAIFAELLLALDASDFLARRAPGWLRRQRVPHQNIALKAKSGSLQFEPLGVVAILSPWNYPFAIPMAQIVPALLAGNSVLFKPSELTPATGALIGELLHLAGLPLDLVQVPQGGASVGAAIVEAGPDKIFFTGSVATGRRIGESCGRKLIPSALELGGKDAMLVLADADLDIASSAAVWGSFTNCGQTCLSVERIYVERSIADRFTELCVAKTKQLRLGAPTDPDAEIGPMIRLAQLERVEAQLADATARGAQILAGGLRRPDLGPNFFAPTVIANVNHSMLIMRDETFGPVLAIHPVASAHEAVERANDSPFALSASVWTRDARAGENLAVRLHAGSVMVNDVASYYGIAEAPHGGRGLSGWGRTHSRFGLLEMVHVKYIDVDRLPGLAKSWWFGYTGELAVAAGRFVELLSAPSWRRRLSAMLDPAGARRVILRRGRI